MRRGFYMALLLCLGPWAIALAGEVCTIRIDGPIGPATASYISRAIAEASSRNAECLIVGLDTPGGLLESTKDIVREMLASPVPVVVYVAPPGAGATSAGCFITLAADVAAMAPATTIGAAHPVAIGGGSEEQLSDTMKQKLENYSVSYIEAIAAKRRRNVEWAKSSVKDSASITAEKARELKVIEIIAADERDLLKQLDGRIVNGRTLHTAGAGVVAIPLRPSEKFFQVLWHPEVMFLLMLVAMYGIIGELSNPGAILPGVAGAIALVLMLYMSAVLPVNIAGLALIGVAMALFIIDVFAPTHGILTGGGIVAFFLGGFMMFDRAEPLWRLSLGMLIPATAVTAAFFIVGAGLRAQWLPSQVGVHTLVGKTAPALTPIDGAGGKIQIEGEYWNAIAAEPLPQGASVEIVAVHGLTLTVRRKQS
ncbi:MAG: nodulation protein NfeD [Tepidisphaerales bacterium]